MILLVAAVVGARLGGWLQFMSTGATLTMAALALVPLALWWLYQYVDWANDIYQVTAAQILDVYKKPLAREVRKVAPLENILGTEVAQRGILGLLLNFGDVVANVGTEKFTFQGVCDPTSVQQDIVRAQEAFAEKKKESVPGFLGEVERHQAVTVKGVDRRGKPPRIKADGWLARILQHEVDHLEGILYIDRASKVWRAEESQVEAPIPA
ncbi:MAG TPA: peptide deformylase [Anaerolineales bacterium]|nr:peptide deformylase [Anaerolineales bacterium]